MKNLNKLFAIMCLPLLNFINPNELHQPKEEQICLLFRKNTSLEIMKTNKLNRGQNNARSSDTTEVICHLVGHKFSQFQALSSHFVNKKLKLYVLIMSRTSFRVNLHCIVCLNVKEILAGSRCHI